MTFQSVFQNPVTYDISNILLTDAGCMVQSLSLRIPIGTLSVLTTE